MAATLARLGEVLGRDVGPADVEPVVWARAQFAPSFTAVDYARGLAAQARYRRAVQQWWADGWDLLLTPTVDRPPEPIDETAPHTLDDSAGRARAGMTAFTRPFNTTGQPAISLPLHQTADNLPVGIQLVGAYGREDVLIRVASQLEQAQPWTTRHPDTSGAGHAPS
jgi:amidase